MHTGCKSVCVSCSACRAEIREVLFKTLFGGRIFSIRVKKALSDVRLKRRLV